jgi:hypothetical protein
MPLGFGLHFLQSLTSEEPTRVQPPAGLPMKLGQVSLTLIQVEPEVQLEQA